MNNAPNIPEWVMSSAVRRRAFAEGLAEGRKIERAAIANWLRGQDGHGYDDMRANLIEAGEHRRHNPNCAVVRNGNLRAWCDCGLETKESMK